MLEIRSPWNLEIIKKIKCHNENEIEKIISSAHKTAQDKAVSFPKKDRIQILNKFSKKIKQNINELAKLATNEGGKPLQDSIIEINRGAEGVDSAIEVLKSDAGSVIPMNINEASNNRIAFTQKEPIGIVLAISAFNHPFNLIIHQIIPAIASGCVVIVKPAEDTPLSCIKILEMLLESGLPENRCYFCMPENLKLAEKLVSDERIDFLSFIGSAKIGWMLRSKLSPGTRCALEHGGMAPTFLTETTNLDIASKLLIKGGFYHAGQVCVSVQRVFVQKKIFDDFLSIFEKNLKPLKIGNPLDKNTEVGPLIRPSEVDRVQEWVNESISQGTSVLCGGNKISETCFDKTVLINPRFSDKVSKMEIFGPVVNIYSYEDINKAIEIANDTNVSFQASIFSNDIDQTMNFYKKINASAVFHNDHTAFRVDWMPFAGLKHSGHGVGGIKYTMHEMQIEKMMVLRN